MSSKVQTIDIHGKAYVTVAERVRLVHEELKEVSINTEVVANDPVVIKATVQTPKGTFTGISAANPSKMIEKTSPYEVAETSAVGRALGFAGYGVVEGIASADEVTKAESVEVAEDKGPDTLCQKCKKGHMIFRSGVKKGTDNNGEEIGRPWAGNFCNNPACDNKIWKHV